MTDLAPAGPFRDNPSAGLAVWVTPSTACRGMKPWKMASGSTRPEGERAPMQSGNSDEFPADLQADLDARLARAMLSDDPPEPSAPAKSRSTAVSTAKPRPAPTTAAARAPAPPRSGRREKTILLGLLGTLAGAFVGVLSMKLLVPRPPAGAGPDVHVENVSGSALDIVEPPPLTVPPSPPPSLPDPFRTAGLAAAPPEEAFATPQAAAGSAFDDARIPDPAAPFPRSRFASGDAVADDRAAPRRFGGASDEEGLVVAPPPDLQPVPVTAATGPAATGPGNPPAGLADNPFRRGPQPPSPARPNSRVASSSPLPPGFAGGVPGQAVLPASAALPPSSPGVADNHVVREGDSWWSIAESAYGDGRLYKALFAWNRRLDPRVSTTPGTRIEVPREEQLRAAWGRLVP